MLKRVNDADGVELTARCAKALRQVLGKDVNRQLHRSTEALNQMNLD